MFINVSLREMEWFLAWTIDISLQVARFF